MNDRSVFEDLRQGLAETPMLDAHTHLTGGRMLAHGLHDVLLYHMVISDLYAAGCPSGARLTEFPGWPSREEAHHRLREALPYLPHIQNTNCAWGVRIILRDLYGWTEPVTADNWEKLDAMIRERADDRAATRALIRGMNIRRFTTELARRNPSGQDDDILHYSMEWAFFTRTQRGEYDTALFELERCWGKPPGSPIPHAATHRPPVERTVRSVEDVHQAMAHFVGRLAAAPVVSFATHVSGDVAFRPVSDAEMAAALSRRNVAGPAERDIYVSYVHEAFLNALEPYAGRIAFQFSLGAEPLPHETSSLIPQRALADTADMIARHPKIRFVCLLSSRHADQSLCTFCRELPNFALAGYWWHNFFPGAMRQVMEERLDMLPVNRQIGFFSDAYTIEWTYAKAAIVRNQLAQVLTQKVLQGQYTVEEALRTARAILFDSPQQLLSNTPAEV